MMIEEHTIGNTKIKFYDDYIVQEILKSNFMMTISFKIAIIKKNI